MTYLYSGNTYETGLWYHVVGTYDGANQLIYVNGRLEAQGKDQSGDIVYPPKALFTIGCYLDDNERYPLSGEMESASVWERVLSGAEIAARYQQGRSRFPK